MAVAEYLDKYFECVEYLPLDLQRCVTQLRLLEMDATGVVEEIKKLRSNLCVAMEDGDTVRQQIVVRQLQQGLINIRNLGNKKLVISAQLLETIEDYEQQLAQKHKAVDNSSTDEFYQAHRLSTNTNHSGLKDSSGSISNGALEAKSSIKRSSGTKRVRPQPVDRDEDHPPISNGRSSNSLSTGSAPHSNNGRSAKKKIKAFKKKTASVTMKVAMATERESPPPFTPSAHVPMPDLTSQPLDPDEPTYCLCQQVSFGEMIGCDNEDCPIEWFHFQCVNLTSKPKGKWFCPQCSQGRRSKPVK